jgi:hypothetical protein
MRREQRKLFADKCADLGNLAVAGMVFTQVVLGIHADPFALKLGLTIAILSYFEAYLLSV